MKILLAILFVSRAIPAPAQQPPGTIEVGRSETDGKLSIFIKRISELTFDELKKLTSDAIASLTRADRDSLKMRSLELKKENTPLSFAEITDSLKYRGRYYTIDSSKNYVEDKAHKDDSFYKWDPAWNKFIADELVKHSIFLDNSKLPQDDINLLYPDFFKPTTSDNEKIAFWTLLLSSLTVPESQFNPSAQFREKSGGMSEGLLQLSYNNAEWYSEKYSLVLLDEKKKNIFDPQVNLQTGVVMLAWQLEKKQQLFGLDGKGGSFKGHWSSFNIHDKDHVDSVVKFFKKHSADLKNKYK
ncbi:transglycosylase SLT domain-containing protein [Mucilaginibacter sp. OK098]|uniref:transglycosylase SLT domain-containing protein n=1 Tax=Mucilaginibacter sp. OK098 TaxID=1855297 RepID=UPI0013562E7B|nr:transglycosylase SLT domain-containing protein [Mucilaginibacter sp. OK098]